MKEKNPSQAFSIPIKGIATKAGIANPVPGACTEIINLRPREGNWESVGGFMALEPFENLSIDNEFGIYKHPVGGVFYFYVNSNAVYNTFSETAMLTLQQDEEFESFAHLGYFLFINTTQRVYRFVYDNDIAGYTLLPELTIPVVTASTYSDNNHESPTGNVSLDTAIGNYYEHISNKKENGFYEGVFSVIAAYKLYDGTYIYHGHPSVCVLGMRDNDDAYNSGVGHHGLFLFNDGGVYQFSWVYKNKFQIEYESNNFNFLADLSPYKDLIKSLDFFMTPIVSYYDIEELKRLVSEINIGDFTEMACPVSKDFYKSFTEQTYYKVHSIDFANIHGYEGNIFISKDMINAIQTNEVLPVDAETNHSTKGAGTMVYNGSLVYNNTTTILSNGYDMHLQANRIDLAYLANWANGLPVVGSTYVSERQFYSVVFLKTDEGERKVILPIKEYWWTIGLQGFFEKTAMILPPILTYPDSRAYKIVIGYLDGNSIRPCKYFTFTDTETYVVVEKAEFTLTAHSFHNYSYYVQKDPYLEYIFITEATTTNATIPLTTNNQIHNENYIKASQVNNPFLFPAERTYPIGDKSLEVVSVAITREAISQGQYGQFPLYAFTTQGIYLLEVGDGDILFSRVIPMNSEIISNRSVMPVSNSILFVTKEGVKIISGNQVQNISQLIRDGYKNKLIGETDFTSFIEDETHLIDVGNELNTVETTTLQFIAYIQSALIAYNSYEDEVIFCQPEMTYSYVYNIKAQSWYKITQTFDTVIQNYPGYLIKKGGNLYDLTQVETSTFLPVFLQTEPIKLSDGYFKLENVKLLCYIHNEYELDKSLGFYAFGSVDGNNYKLVNGRQLQIDDINGITFNRFSGHFSVRSIIFVFAGSVTDSELTGIVGTFVPKYQNKIR